ncbi:hypothetical protein MLD38_027628 [Melastoma candidum]|uniref:Uncharacterized protein n=1 Tax=Melastoma candidum TaxID=119954 RepID=A0ACB9P833_9MYRT|nr:hypothetical protein MLD38_027628 [Melastoma candidum]
MSPFPTTHLPPSDPAPIDYLDRLPDPLLLHILNYISDIKSLGRCSAVSRRFRLLAPLVSSVLIRVDCIISDDNPDPPSSSSSAAAVSLPNAANKPSIFFVRFPLFSSLLRSFVSHILLKPLQSLGFLSSLPRRIPGSPSLSADSNTSAASSSVTHHSPVQVLKNFSDLRSLRIDLPSGELSLNDSSSSSDTSSSSSTLLRWRAHFGSSLDRCLILAAASHAKSLNTGLAGSGGESATVDNGTIPDSFYTNGGLKLRVVWTISSLIAASARHYLLQPIIAEHPTLESLVLTDADGQGVLRMDREQLEELRTKPLSASSASKRTMVPALSMRLWYAPILELSSGVVLKGATLVAIRPSGGEKKELGLGWIEEAFDGEGEEGDWMYAEAVRMLVKRRTYCLEMNSF